MPSTKLSFLVTYYNQEKYVDDSLRNIFMLNIPCDYEVLVGDDGSIDSTVNKVNEWRGKFGGRLQLFQMEREADKERNLVIRASNLRKFLLKKSTGNYFCILDGDDYYCDRDFIVTALQSYEEYADVSVVMFSYQMVYPDRTQAAKPIPKEGIIDGKEYVGKYAYRPAGACVFKKYAEADYLQRISDALYYDDSDILIYNLGFGKLIYKDKVVYSYRQHDTSIWNTMSCAQQGILNMVGADNEIFLAPQFRNEILFRYRRDILYAYFRRKCPDKVIGKEFLNYYIAQCSNRAGYMSRVLLDYENATEEEKDMVDGIIAYIREKDENMYKSVEADCAVVQ